ncbi:Protein PHLOEM PROTEIN 2-LIKE A10 [Tetrabaena socialis]|uniref:Protein PHLOEM PROTEIN 2-LIKE A10 n=1 Tax=Tetrabaena socialis TaxID=47790 RepID=A0A2J7ZSH2_9CHLO|nr:Protein PHLOEM PROTEIN 2-LIKE A10 [Tetrabaena socialis]|eukprot:PNH03222.1 Protein PHLOEM PROTEIN 2-LIKE A10 [Tetrabaena socialis]
MSAPGRGSRNPALQWYEANKTLVWGTAAAAVTLYAAYKATASSPSHDDADADPSTSCASGSSPRPPRQQPRPTGRFQQLRTTLSNYTDAASCLAETAALVSTDLRAFLASDSGELPQSLRQLNKLLQSSELQATVATVTASVVRGASSALAAPGPSGSGSPSRPLVDTLIEAVLSERGQGLVGMAVGVATRNASTAVCEFLERRLAAASAASSGSEGGGGGGVASARDVLALLSSEPGEKLLTLLLTKSIRAAVTSYVESTTGYNVYDDMLSSISRPEHRDALTEVLSRVTASFCRELVVSYRRATAAAAAGAPAGGAGGGGGGAGGGSAANHAAAAKNAAAAAVAAGGGGSREGSVSVLAAAGVQAALSHGEEASALAAAGTSGRPHGQPLGGGGGQNGRLSLGAAHKQGLQGSGGSGGSSSALIVGGGGGGGGGGWGLGANALGASWGRGLAVQPSPPWLRQGSGPDGSPGSSRALMLPPGASVAKLYVLATLAVSLCMYALSPRLIML